MTLEEIVGWYLANKLSFYHFTDTRNLDNIRKNGLMSKHLLDQEGTVAVCGGNEWSLQADNTCGMDKYVHLSFSPNHPLEYLARRDNRIEKSRFIRVAPEVLLVDGVKVCDRVANKAGTVPGAPLEMLRTLDLEVLYLRKDWNDPAIKERLKVARLYEVIVPHRIPVQYLSNL